MKHGVAIFVGHLEVGDVVRLIKGGLVPVPDRSAPAITITLLDGSKKVCESTKGWRNPPIGGPEDYINAFEHAQVTRKTDTEVTFIRPYVLEGRVQYEIWTAPRDHGGLWYELLSNRPVTVTQP